MAQRTRGICSSRSSRSPVGSSISSLLVLSLFCCLTRIRMGTEEVVDLLDRHWFFLNVLKSNDPRQAPPSLRPTLPSSPDKTKALGVVGTPCRVKAATRKLLRAPSMPNSTRTRPEELSTTTCSRKVLAVSTLARAPSLPVYCNDDDDSMQQNRDRSRSMLAKKSKLQRSSSSGWATLNPSIPRFRPPPRDRPAIQGKKWRSYSDLESFEVQGFKDLGFVFDGVASSTGSLANVIPGLRYKKPSDGHREYGKGLVTRPYLSEAWWFEERVAHAPPKLVWAETITGAEMKQQLRSWARTVACNARERNADSIHHLSLGLQ
ncbi:hypothetical protein ZIOFF_033561 [Zingiber officinale]|uniref:Uncharacterized protein n=1 Tax=Zingiber officinale TaxID=94328 RepID=A0A8J5L7G3_ZINOF|nr:hypothetical protein ZIOFF_033561 [Zingiber officinale]